MNNAGSKLKIPEFRCCTFCDVMFMATYSGKVLCSKECGIKSHKQTDKYKSNQSAYIQNPDVKKKLKEYHKVWDKDRYVRMGGSQNPERQKVYRKHSLKKNFGITPEAYDAMVQERDGKCDICGTTETGAAHYKNMPIDHCHVSGKIRGLLCANCNFVIGHAKDSIEVLEKAIAYLKRHS